MKSANAKTVTNPRLQVLPCEIHIGILYEVPEKALDS
jgi:hypothetical protein